MGILADSAIVGAATFLVGSVLMGLSIKQEGKDVKWWPYVGTFIAGSLGFYLVAVNDVIEVKDAESFSASGAGSIYSDGGRMVSIEENTTVNYNWNTDPDDTDADGWDIESQVEDKVLNEMHEDDSGGDYWSFNDSDGTNVDVNYEWDKTVVDGDEEYIKSWAETDESFNTETETKCKYCELNDPENCMYFGPSCLDAESFSAEGRKPRRRSRLAWTRGYDPAYTDSEGKMDTDNLSYGDRLKDDIMRRPSKDAYHISPLPEGYFIHLWKNTDNGWWYSYMKSPYQTTVNRVMKINKKGVIQQTLDWYNESIKTPEAVGGLTPMEVMLRDAGLITQTPMIKRVFVKGYERKAYRDGKQRVTHTIHDEYQWYGYGGPDSLEVRKIASLRKVRRDEAGWKSSRMKGDGFNVRVFPDPKYAFANNFLRGLLFLDAKKSGKESSIDKYNDNSKKWVTNSKLHPAWFQNACKQNVVNMRIRGEYEKDDNFKKTGKVIFSINGVKFLEFNHYLSPTVPLEFSVYDGNTGGLVPVTKTIMRKMWAQSHDESDILIKVEDSWAYWSIFAQCVAKYQPQKLDAFTKNIEKWPSVISHEGISDNRPFTDRKGDVKSGGKYIDKAAHLFLRRLGKKKLNSFEAEDSKKPCDSCILWNKQVKMLKNEDPIECKGVVGSCYYCECHCLGECHCGAKQEGRGFEERKTFCEYSRGCEDCDECCSDCICDYCGSEDNWDAEGLEIPTNISNLMRAFEKSGFTILIVGGAVRDSLLDKIPKDYDLATNAKPHEIERVVDGLKGYRYVLGPKAEKALRNLTSLVTVPNEIEAVEITTFRKEFGYKDGIRTQGEFKPADTFEEDAQRRDLTINAMGMNVDGEIIDPMGGQEDLHDGVIRAVGDPTQRFVEDPLRMIRAIRFAVRLGLPIEENTYQAIVSNADLVSTLSGRRLRDEIGNVIVEPNGYQMLMETGILPTLMPEFRGMKDYHHKLDYHPEDTLYNHYIEAFKTFTKIPNRSELGAWALLFHDIAKPQTAEWSEENGYHTFYGHDKQGGLLVLENYNNQNGPFEFSKKELQSIAWTTDNHLGKFWEMKKPTKVAKMRNNENFPLLVQVVTGDTMGVRRGGDEALAARLIEIDEITNKVNEQKVKTGNRPKDFAQKLIKELNVQGQGISIALNEIEELVSTGQVQSYDEALEVLKTKRGV